MAHLCNCSIAFALKIFQDRLEITLGSVIDAFATRLEVSQAILIPTRKRKYKTQECIEMVQNSPVLVDEMVKGNATGGTIVTTNSNSQLRVNR